MSDGSRLWGLPPFAPGYRACGLLLHEAAMLQLRREQAYVRESVAGS